MTVKRAAGNRAGFTLIELMVVILIIAILVGAVVAIGMQVKTTSQRKATLATLKTLDAMMKDYIAAGNPEPQPVAAAAWTYSPPSVSGYAGYNGLYYGNPPPPRGYLPTVPASDPINWVKAFEAVPELKKKMGTMMTGVDIVVNDWNQPCPTNPALDRWTGGTGSNMVVLDAWGTPIRYVPAGTVPVNVSGAPGGVGMPGYFVSAGPDGYFFSTSAGYFINGYAPLIKKNDDIFSYDAQQ